MLVYVHGDNADNVCDADVQSCCTEGTTDEHWFQLLGMRHANCRVSSKINLAIVRVARNWQPALVDICHHLASVMSACQALIFP